MKLHPAFRLFAIGTIIATLFSLNVMAQTAPTIQVTGLIADSVTHQGLIGITVRLKDARNTDIKVTATNKNGGFKLFIPSVSTYTLTINAVGYRSLAIPLQLTTLKEPIITLKPIYLSESSTGLREVAVKANRVLIRQKADRIIYDLKADPQSKTSNILTIMRKVPYLSVDGDDNLLMKGNSSFRILINGKPSSSLEGNLKSVLRSIPASTIDRIEVITTPPAKYDAEGLAGIINIVTIKRLSNGYDGAVNLNESFPVGGPGIGGTFNVKQGKLGVSGYGGGSLYHSPETSNHNTRTDNAGTLLQQEGIQHSDNRTAYLGTTLSYQMDTLHLLTAQLNANTIHLKEKNSQFSQLTAAGNILQQYAFDNDAKYTSFGLDAGLNYELGFKANKNRLLTLSYLFSTNLNNKSGEIDYSNSVAFNALDLLQKDHQQFKEHTFQLDFMTPVKKITINTGLKGILRSNSSDFGYAPFNASAGQYIINPALSNTFNNTQNVFSAYNSYQFNLNSWNINAGVRLEETSIRADFSNSGTLPHQDYFNAIPSLAIGKGFKDGSNINFGFSQRIRRPSIGRLNPYIDRSNPNFEIAGNPNLRPVLLNDIQFGYSSNKKLSVNLGLDYSFIRNLDLQVVDFNPATQVTRITYANTGRSSSAASSVNLSYPVTQAFTISLNGNVIYLWLSGQSAGEPVTNNLLFYSATLSNNMRLPHNWNLSADLSLNSRTPTGLQGYTNGYFYSAFSFNKDIIKDKFSIGGSIKNPFSKYRYQKNTTFGPQFQQLYESQVYFRSLNISLNYKFGGLQSRIQKNRVGIRNNDLGN